MSLHSTKILHGRGNINNSNQIGDQRMVGVILTKIGTIHHDRGEYHRALELYEQILDMSRKIGDQHMIGDNG